VKVENGSDSKKRRKSTYHETRGYLSHLVQPSLRLLHHSLDFFVAPHTCERPDPGLGPAAPHCWHSACISLAWRNVRQFSSLPLACVRMFRYCRWMGVEIEKYGELRVSGKWPVVHCLGIILRKATKGRSSMYFWPPPLEPSPDFMQIAIAVSKHSLTVTARQQSCSHRAIRSLSSYFKSKVSAVSTWICHFAAQPQSRAQVGEKAFQTPKLSSTHLSPWVAAPQR
jgi:hypothetical protein